MADEIPVSQQHDSSPPHLSLCPPDKKNCVCSLDPSKPHHIPPFDTQGEGKALFAGLKQMLSTNPRYRLLRVTPAYLHAEYRSPWIGFIDDVEFLLSPEERKIHVRSASRIGYWDLGANRRRIERLRTKLSARSASFDTD